LTSLGFGGFSVDQPYHLVIIAVQNAAKSEPSSLLLSTAFIAYCVLAI